MLYKILIWLVSAKSTLCGCGADLRQNNFSKGKKEYTITQLATLPKELNESSGLGAANGHFLSHNDSGGKNEVYAFDEKGSLKNTFVLNGTKNVDWETMAQDPKGNFFMGDIGNNCNCRKDLTVYKYNIATQQTSDTISFRYPDQVDFPPQKNKRHFDCEAMIYFRDSLYLFSKNRGEKMVRLYVIPSKSGNYTAFIKDEIRVNTQITDASLNKDGTKFALISYGKVLIFDIKNQQLNFDAPRICLKTRRKMTEAIHFIGNEDFIFSNEQGALYQAKKK